MPLYYKEGEYVCRITGQRLGKAKTGTLQLILTFEVDAGNHSRSIFRALNPNTIDWVLDDLAYLCERNNIPFDIAKFEELDENSDTFLDLRGAEFAGVCVHEAYDGKEREKWSISRPGAGIKVQGLEPEDLRKLNSLFGRDLKKRATKLNSQPAPAPPAPDDTPYSEALPASTAPEKTEDDDVPF